MFTGIIEGLGTLMRSRSADGGLRMTVRAAFDLDGSRIGDSISVNGACLTAVGIESRTFTVDVSPETLSKSTFRRAAAGEIVNLERALRMGDRIDGHLVTGHLDGTGTVVGIKAAGNARVFQFRAPELVTRYMIQKGSVAVDGISLTINTVSHQGFAVSVIPHTAQVTTLGRKKIGDTVNLEADMIGKYVERFTMQPREAAVQKAPAADIDREFLARYGF